MATENRTERDPLIDAIAEQATSFEFFQAVRLAQLANPDAAPVGRQPNPERESIRFRSEIAFGFPASDIAKVTPRREPEEPHEVSINFLGVATPASKGALPTWYSFEILEQEKGDRRSTALRDFFDQFNHRLISFFFRAWEKNSFAFHHEAIRDGVLQQLLFSMVGLGTDRVRRRLAIDDRALLHHAGALSRRPVSAAALAEIVQSYFGQPVRVLQFVKQLHPLDPSDRLLFGSERFRLGSTACLGESVELSHASFRLRLGPLSWDEYLSFLPGGSRFLELADLVRFAVGAEFDFDAQLVLRANEVPAIHLEEQYLGRIRLGWTTWLGERLTHEDADDAIVPVSETAEGS